MSRTPFTPEHVTLLEASAISPAFAREWGILEVREPADLKPHNMEWAGEGQDKGLLFPLHRADGTVIPQYRPDNPLDGKYLQAAGSGSVLVVAPMMRDRVGKATEVLVTEGTKQTVAACRYAPLDTLVVGVQGCGNWSKDGVPLSDLDALVANAAAVTIAFDGDLTKNLDVHTAGGILADHIAAVSGADVNFIKLPAQGKAGLDDWLGERKVIVQGVLDERGTDELRAKGLANLIAAAKPLPKRAPAAKKRPTAQAAGTPISDMRTGTIREADSTFSGTTTPGRVIAHFAAEFHESFDVADDLAGGTKAEQFRGVEHTLRIVTGLEGTPERREWFVEGVSDDMLDKVPWWLARANISLTKVWYESAYAYREVIKQAIRAASVDGIERLRFMRGGIVQLPEVGAVYLHGGGALGEPGETRAAMASLSGGLAAISYPDPSKMTAEEIRADVACDFEVLELLNDPTPWIVMEAIRCFALSGAVNSGDPARIGVFIDGPPASGKTTVTRTYTSAFGLRFYGNAMQSAHDTGLALGTAGAGLQDGVLVVDDLLKRSEIADPLVLKEQMKAIDLMARRSHAGGSEGHGRLVKSDKAGISYEREAPNAASPVIIMCGEEKIPARSYASTVQRLFNVSITAASTMKDDGKSTARMKAIGASGSRNRSTAVFLQHQMALINAAGGVDSYRLVQKEARAKYEAEITRDVLELETHRSREQLAALFIGLECWMTFGEAVGAITKEKSWAIESGAKRLLIAAAVKNLVVNIGSVRKHAEGTLESLRALVAQGRATVDCSSSLASVPTIGKQTQWNGVKYMALNPTAVAAVLGLRSHADRDLGASRAIAALTDMYIPHSDRKVLHKVRLTNDGAAGIGCLMVPLDAWLGADDDAEGDTTTATRIHAGDPFDEAALEGRDEYGDWLPAAA